MSSHTRHKPAPLRKATTGHTGHTAPSHKVATVRSFAPGMASEKRTYRDCPGCIEHPAPWCAACGAPAAYAMPSDELHALSLCRACALVMYGWRAEALAAKQAEKDRQRLAQKAKHEPEREGARIVQPELIGSVA
jgi:hypothetical protein